MGMQAITNRLKLVIPYVYVFFCSLLLSLYGTNNPFHIGNTGIDSSVFNYVARVILDGGMPYRDTFDHKGPLIYLIDALGLLINRQIGIWILELVTVFIICLCSYKIARYLDNNKLFSCCVVTVGVFSLAQYFEGGNFTEEYACAFIIISLYHFLKFFTEDKADCYDWILCGACFAAVCMLRANMVSIWIVMCFGVVYKHIASNEIKPVLTFMASFLTGTILVIGPIFFWLISNNAFDAFVWDYIFFNLEYSSDPVRASLSNRVEAFRYFIDDPIVMISLPSLLYLCVKKKKFTDLLCALTFALTLVMISMSGQKYGHYGIILQPFIVHGVARSFNVFNSLKVATTLEKKLKVIITVVYFIILADLGIPLFIFASTILKGPNFNSTGYLETRSYIANVVKSITAENDSITVCGNNNIIYLLSNRKSVSKYSYQYPIAHISPTIWREYCLDLQTLNAKVIVLMGGIKDLKPYVQIKDLIKRHYKLVKVIDGTEIYITNEKQSKKVEELGESS